MANKLTYLTGLPYEMVKDADALIKGCTDLSWGRIIVDDNNALYLDHHIYNCRCGRNVYLQKWAWRCKPVWIGKCEKCKTVYYACVNDVYETIKEKDDYTL
ncbi:MAG: hypothetical protein ACYC27_03015 [Armatimonadota bacterium]